MPDSVGHAMFSAMTKNKAVSRSVKVAVSLAALAGLVQAGSGSSTASRPEPPSSTLQRVPCYTGTPFVQMWGGDFQFHWYRCSKDGAYVLLE